MSARMRPKNLSPSIDVSVTAPAATKIPERRRRRRGALLLAVAIAADLRRIDAAYPHQHFELLAEPDRNARFQRIPIDDALDLGGVGPVQPLGCERPGRSERHHHRRHNRQSCMKAL